ncbi:hypothetical protein PN498_16615 [Oscillatoria sp. CS-180]|uniref:hypothetical protein n=1 Tax=Oscillatoria sp. CS-180 TaxID=3021720 RepID=UPI00232FE843|nr:hypothetical protein [Oscillatoria sp. CS-180]MDB9527621.1 hypothetical protein [Oscillatoria sp. CS-180]
MSFPNQDRRDDVIYILLNKVKHTGEEAEDVAFYDADFEGKMIDQAVVQQHLQYVIDGGYLKGSLVKADEDGENSPLAVCKNAQITSEGTKILRMKYFMV